MKIQQIFTKFYNYINKIIIKNILTIAITGVLFIFALYLGYIVRDVRIQKLVKTVNIYNQSESSLINIIQELNVELTEFNRLKSDGDYYRYLIFKESGILIPESTKNTDIILMYKMATKYEIPYKYYFRLIQQESRFNHKAKSPVGASGYMQIMPNTYKGLLKRYKKSLDNKELNIKNLSQNEKNIVLGSFYLNYLYSLYGDWKLTFAAYNAGPGNVQNYKGVPPFKETKNYIAFIMKN